MQDTVNMIAVFNSMDTRKAQAEAMLAQYTNAQVAEASRIAHLYDRCDVTSLKHKEDTVRILTRGF
jgi:hypothetical protein